MALTYLNSRMIEEPAVLDQLFVTSLTALSTTIQNTLTNDLTSFNATNASIIQVDSADNALRITQTGSGNALLVEDSANPDITPFVITSGGRVGIGTVLPNSELDVNGIIRSQSILSNTIGLGTLTPIVALDVVGDGRIGILSATEIVTQNVVLPQAGGNIINDAAFFGNITIYGAISALSGLAVTSTFTSQSSALSVVNTGPEIALYVEQGPNLSGVAVFVGSGTEVLKINNPNPNPSFLPAVVVNGVLSAGSGTSTNWNNVFTNVRSNSANWTSAYTASLSSNLWNSAYAITTALSSDFWNSVYTNVQTNSASWSYGGNVGTVYSTNSASYPKRFATNIGNGSLTAFEVTHSLGTRDVITQVYDNATYEVVLPSISNLTTNTVGLSFDAPPALNAFRVVVIG